MITLKTLPQATAQEVFDQVATHLLTQNKRSERGGRCTYQGINGTKCAAGCLISDDEYIPEMENIGHWAKLISQNLVPENHALLIRNLQIVHDGYVPLEWKQELKRVADNYNLTFNPPQNSWL